MEEIREIKLLDTVIYRSYVGNKTNNGFMP